MRILYLCAFVPYPVRDGDCVRADLTLRLLREDGVLVHPGYFYDFPAGSFLVLSLLPPTGAFREGAARLAGRLRSLSKAR